MAALLPGGSAAAQDGAATAVDLALVLAVDVSSSVDAREFRLQMRGYADAFRNPRVIQAATTGLQKRIAVTLVQWSNLHDQRQVVPWTILGSEPEAAALADAIERAPRAVPPGSTSISGAIDFAARLIAGSGYRAARRVIDVSGDGLNNQGRPPAAARDTATAAGITVNGLAITSEVLALDIYFEDNVIGGPGAFSVATDSFDRFPEAILKKLLREIVEAASGPQLAEAGTE